MPTENRDNTFVIGFPVTRYVDPTMVTTAEAEPLPRNQNPHPYKKWRILSISLFILFLMLFVSLGLYSYYFEHHIRSPVIQIQSITPSNITSSNNNISTNWNLTFSLQNPNKYASIYYRMIHVWVSDKDKRTVSSSNLDYFYQDKTEQGDINVEISGLVVDLENKQKKMNGASQILVLSLKLDAMVWVAATRHAKKCWQLLEASCGEVIVQPPMSLTLDGSGRCKVNLQ